MTNINLIGNYINFTRLWVSESQKPDLPDVLCFPYTTEHSVFRFIWQIRYWVDCWVHYENVIKKFTCSKN